MSAPVSTLYLIPHAHTDLGYTHDPLITWELHDHFLDRAIDLCEATADAAEYERYYWTIEVFATLEHWWARRETSHKDRLLKLMRAGQIDLGLRYLNGNFLNNPLNIAWEVERSTRFCREHGLPCTSAIQNDVNGFSLRYARELAAQGARGLVMGLNTTMGSSPFPRPGAFWWNLGDGHRFIVWNGWIYNRIGRWVHLHELEQGLEAVWPECVSRLPEGYPFPFAMMSGTIGDNVGPFARLPQQVAAFNAKQCGLEVRLATFTQFLQVVAQTPDLPEYAGDWNDGWPFGNGSLPHEVTMVRRAQRRLEVIDGMRSLGKVDVPGLPGLLERAQHEVSVACEHTYESHTSENDHTLGDDGKRQWVQCQVNFPNAESLSMLALRRQFFTQAESISVERPSVLLINPTEHALPARILWNERLATHITTSGVIEHLAQFDREPTIEGLTRDPDIGIPFIELPPQSVQVVALERLPAPVKVESLPEREISSSSLQLQVAEDGSLAALQTRDGHQWISPSAPWKFGLPVIEKPLTSLKFKSESEKRDPSDAEWNPDLAFDHRPLGLLESVAGSRSPYWKQISVGFTDSPIRKVSYRLDDLHPDWLELEVEVRLDSSTDQKAFYLPLSFDLGEEGLCDFRYDSCGEWILAPEGQLPGSATSFYETYRGVAISRGSRTVYVIAPEAPLWQFGGFTYGHPQARLDRSQATVMSWLYNNYWYTNFPSTAPGWYRLRYLVSLQEGGFDAAHADRLYSQFKVPFLHHPVWPYLR